MTKAKAASTLMLARDHQDKLEVLLLKRNKALAFAAGLWVFPGGKIEDAEKENSVDELTAAKLAAIRETKEESNVEVDPGSLIYFRHWTTPVAEPRRYATWFFYGEAQSGNSEVQIDDSEIKNHRWIHPQEALDTFAQGELAMMPPTIMSLQLIRKCNSVLDVRNLLQEEEPLYITPVLQRQGPNMICMYEGDAGYASGDASLAGPRHRMILNMKGGKFDFEYKDCEGQRPVNGGMHL